MHSILDDMKNFNKMFPKKKPKPIEIRWDSRYSDTMEDDWRGRWARIAYAGRLTNGCVPFYYGKVCYWEIAWIKKVKFKGIVKFTVNPIFPYTGGLVFDTLDEAKKEVEKHFRWFIKMVTINTKER